MWMTPGPITTMNSTGKMKITKGTMIFTGTFCAFSSASWRRLIRASFDCSRSTFATGIPNASACVREETKERSSGTVVRSVPVVDAWEEPEEWQEPRPALFVQDGIAYVTDPAGRAIHAVDYVGGEVWKSAELDVVPNELNGVTGKPATTGGHDADEHAHEDGEHGHDEPAHDEHEGHDHEHEDG